MLSMNFGDLEGRRKNVWATWKECPGTDETRKRGFIISNCPKAGKRNVLCLCRSSRKPKDIERRVTPRSYNTKRVILRLCQRETYSGAMGLRQRPPCACRMPADEEEGRVFPVDPEWGVTVCQGGAV